MRQKLKNIKMSKKQLGFAGNIAVSKKLNWQCNEPAQMVNV